ncbi:DUF397 domain-containing protein [Streptomyces cucumeris]|uniref:DUF397 domain-containing protein n=1 Tax=Streptomyces cucumeris TaxID=2962890 RepID=UPI0020C919E0|nr:DUF397 domain-containing protein [Streptomyces sp. NEAU-Y11]MCP9211467.1 DUF397 domain-containing protein [Streptomyces sp. NEAU-Y11]
MTNQHRRPAPEVDLTGAAWRKSSYSSGTGACLEIAITGGIVALRDSKDISRPAMLFSTDAWTAFVRGAAEGEFIQS